MTERLDQVVADGISVWQSFQEQIRPYGFHTFMPGHYESVRDTLTAVLATASRKDTAPRFLELGSATGVITIMADIMGYRTASGIEIDPFLVEAARALARRHGSRARFAAGSFLPAGYTWHDERGDSRLGTLGLGAAAYSSLGHTLDTFDVVYGYPWDGEAQILHDLMARYGAPEALLLLHGGAGRITVYRQAGRQADRRADG